MTTPRLTREHASHFATIALGHVTREYPNKLDHVLAGPADARTPRQLHPIFYGSFDWHSCVHGYWLLARLLRRFPDVAGGRRHPRPLRQRSSRPRRSPANVAYLARPTARGFERPYGWAWLLKLAAELARQSDDALGAATSRRWPTSSPQRFRDFLPMATYPVRAGTHFNTAFAPAPGGRLRRRHDGRRAGRRCCARRPALVRRRRRLPGLG